MPTINKKTVLLNKSERPKERQRYYQSTQWKNLRKIYQQSHPLCEECLKHDIITPAHDIHHKLSPFDPNIGEMERWKRLLDYDNLMALCKDCHGKLHANDQKKKKSQKKWGKSDFHPKNLKLFENTCIFIYVKRS